MLTAGGRQGTGTINMLVFALLSMIADEKRNVIFAIEKPEIAIPPHTQKRIIEAVKATSSQVLLTSHSPHVIEEFPPEEVAVLQRSGDNVAVTPSSLPPTLNMKDGSLGRERLVGHLPLQVVTPEHVLDLVDDVRAWPVSLRSVLIWDLGHLGPTRGSQTRVTSLAKPAGKSTGPAGTKSRRPVSVKTAAAANGTGRPILLLSDGG